MSEQSVQAAPPRNNVEHMARFVVPPTTFNFLRNMENIVRIMMSWSTITLEVFIRREFGERYLSVGRFILGLVTIRFFLGLANIQTAFSFIPGIAPLASERGINRTFLLCFIIISLIHLHHIWKRNRAGVPWHSQSFGVSWLNFLTTMQPIKIGGLQLQISDFVLYRFIEPGLCLLVAWFLIPGPSFTQSWLLWSSVAMLVHNNMQFHARRGRFLDMLDSQIESGYYNTLREDALEPTTQYQTAGHAAMPVPPKPLLEKMHQADIQATVMETMGGVAD